MINFDLSSFLGGGDDGDTSVVKLLVNLGKMGVTGLNNSSRL